MQTMFRHKPEFHFNKFTVEKTVIIPARKLEEMLRHPMLDHQATRDNAGVMGVDGDGVYHCLLVMSYSYIPVIVLFCVAAFLAFISYRGLKTKVEIAEA